MSGQDETHNRVVRFVAANRFPFPDQTDWPDDYVTITNESEPRTGIPTSDGTYYPDIVIVDGNGTIQEVGEVEISVDTEAIDRWRIGSDAARPIPESGVKHFFVYVPSGREAEAQYLLDENGISYAGVRSYEVDDANAVSIVPVTTPGHTKDHR